VSPAPVPVRAGLRAGRLVVGACGLAAAGALLWAAGAALPGPGTFDGAGLAEWIEDEPVVAAFAALRLIGLALVAWVALSSAGAVVVHATRLGRRTTLRRTADRLCLPAVRRLVHGAVGAGFSVAVLAHGAPVGAVVGPSPVVTEAEGGPTTSVPHERAVLVALVDPSASGTPATSTPGTSTTTSATSSTTTTLATTRDVAGPTDLGAETAELWALADLVDGHRPPTAPPTGEDDTATTSAAPPAARADPPATRATTPSTAPPTSSPSDPRSGAPGAPAGARVLERALLVALAPGPPPPPHGPWPVLGRDPGVVRADRGHGSGLHVREPLAAGEHGGGGVRLHDRPQFLRAEVLELAAGPLAVVDLGQVRFGDRGEPAGGHERGERLLAPQQRRADDPREWHRLQTGHQCLGLFAAGLVQLDPW
jgi:hypothetical protein